MIKPNISEYHFDVNYIFFVMSSDSDDYDANNLNNTSEKPKPKKRKRTSNTEDRVSSSVESGDFHVL